MPFKIIKTIENGDVMISAIPEGWEDAGQLWWPQTVGPIDRLRSNEDSRPDTGNWITMECEVKKTGISSFKEALKLEKLYAQVSSSDEECFRMPSGRQRKLPVVLSNFNALIQGIDKEDSPANQVGDEEGKADSRQRTNKDEVSGKFEEHVQEVAQDNSQDAMNEPQETDLQSSSMKIAQKLENMELAVNSAQQNSGSALKVCLEMSVKLDKVLQILSAGSVNAKQISLDELEIFPLKTAAEFEEFEKELQDVAYRAKFLQAMKNIGGVSGKKDGIRIGYKLIDKIFDRQLLQRYSWTGFSKTDPKKSFRESKNFLECFLEIVKAADSRFSEEDCEDFFKNKVLKHSNARASAINK